MPNAAGLFRCPFCSTVFKRKRHLKDCADKWCDAMLERAEGALRWMPAPTTVRVAPREFPKGPITWVQGGLPQ